MIKILSFLVLMFFVNNIFCQEISFGYGVSPTFFNYGDHVKGSVLFDVGKKLKLGLQVLNVNYNFNYARSMTGAHYLHPDAEVGFWYDQYKRGILSTDGFNNYNGIARNIEIYHHFSFILSRKFFEYKKFDFELIGQAGFGVSKNQYFAIFSKDAEWTLKEGEEPEIHFYIDKLITNEFLYDAGITAKLNYNIFRRLAISTDLSFVFYSRDLDAAHLLPSFSLKYNFDEN